LVEILIVVFLVWLHAVLYVAWHQCQTWNNSFDPEDGGRYMPPKRVIYLHHHTVSRPRP